jgi:hypothetical protein
MSAEQQLKTLQSLLTHYAKNAGPRRVPTSLDRSELMALVGARPGMGFVAYPHRWHDGKDWTTTTFELIAK